MCVYPGARPLEPSVGSRDNTLVGGSEGAAGGSGAQPRKLSKYIAISKLEDGAPFKTFRERIIFMIMCGFHDGVPGGVRGAEPPEAFGID